MAERLTCGECGAPVPKGRADGYCAECLLALGLGETAGDGGGGKDDLVGAIAAGWVEEAGGGYELREKVGEGGMGVVYRAWQRDLGRMVAVKLMRGGPFASEAERKRFRSEAQAAAQLQHPNIVAIHDVGEFQGQAFFSMDLVEGPSLAEVVRHAPLSAERAARYVRVIAEAMQHAHERGILHRDLKPANVLLDSRGSPCITDFGLARRVESESGLTQPGAVLGTPSYMSPEQAAGRPELLTRASDVYAMGAILYELLTGRPPFRAETPLATLRQVLESEAASPRVLNRNIPRDLETISLKCLAKEPEGRYATAGELAEELGRFLAGQPIQARPMGRLGRGWRWARRQPGLAGALGSMSLLGLLLAVAAVLQIQDARDANALVSQLASLRIRSQLDGIAAEVVRQADNAELLTAVAARDQATCVRLLAGLAQAYRNRGGTVFPMANWMVVDAEGGVIARWPDGIVPLGFNARVRDYFQGALRRTTEGASSAHVSRVYRSALEQDPLKLDRFGVTVGLRDARGVVGVLSVMVQMGSVEEAFGLTLVQRKLAVVGAYDGDWPTQAQGDAGGPRRFLFMMHPALLRRDRAHVVEHPAFTALIQGPVSPTEPKWRLLYRDPLRHEHLGYGGLWLACFQRVPGTEFIVICQSRNRVAEAAFTAACAMLGLAVVGAMGWQWHRRRWPRRKPVAGSGSDGPRGGG